jgi:hypothetical protein
MAGGLLARSGADAALARVWLGTLACVLRALDRTTEWKKRPLKAQAALNVSFCRRQKKFAAEAGFENSLLGDQYCTGSNAASDQDGYSTKGEATVDSL